MNSINYLLKITKTTFANKMSQVPNLCVDIFTQIYSMLGNLQRVSTNPDNTFSHNQGFTPMPGSLETL